MIGYVSTDAPNMYVKDDILYRSSYCGLCKSIGKTCGQKARFTLNYDLTFLSIIAHNILGVDVEIKKAHCIAHPIKKRDIQVIDSLTNEVACINVILAYHNLRDDVLDQNKHKIFLNLIKGGYKKAIKKYGKYDEVIVKHYNTLRNLESSNCESIDIVSDPFSKMLEEIFTILLKDSATTATKNFAYNLGKWIYLIDALDDFDKDKKTSNYNVFVNAYKNYQTKSQLIKDKRSELEYIFIEIINALNENLNKIEFKFNKDLVENIISRGLIIRTKRVMEN